ncbi:hypothetical protein OpiT1DRAFT_03949 [Opitutaceae bacterium TAV1]|nr:hypothetical protein OpiT1DRAFT_03949 [Opitutaceae bacterium TAV1]
MLAFAVNEAAAGESAKAKSPVVFWAHYMPQIPNGHLHAHPHPGGNNDAWPLFSPQENNPIVEYKQHMRLALASGINGFQMLTFTDEKMYQAAAEILRETGHMFYVAPEWCGIPANKPEKTVQAIETFFKKHQDNPHVYQEKGRQVHFFYGNPGNWSQTPDGIRQMRNELERRGVAVLFVPTIYSFERIALDRPDLISKPWPSGVSQPGPLRWLTETGWKAATGFDFSLSPVAKILDARLRQNASDFLWIPALSAGYDSSNRPVQAIHTPFLGMRNLLDSLRTWISLGYKQITYPTWNDCLESMILPSSRNVYGFNTILRHYRDIAQTGGSTLSEPQVVVSYPVDVLYGDSLYFQVAAIPSAGESIEMRASVELVPVENLPPVVLESTTVCSSATGDPAFVEILWETNNAFSISGVQPFVTIAVRRHPVEATALATREGGGEGEAVWETLYSKIPVSGTRLRYNRIANPVPYAIDLARVSPVAPTLRIEHDSALNVYRGAIDIPPAQRNGGRDVAIRKVHLSEGSMSLGAFRRPVASGPAGDKIDSHWLENTFLRIESSENIPLELRIQNGVIHDFYSPSPDISQAIATFDSSRAKFSSRPPGSHALRSRVARLSLSPDAQIVLDASEPGSSAAKNPIRVMETSFAELATRVHSGGGALVRTVTLGEKKITLGLSLTTDATEPNVDFPLAPRDNYARWLPLDMRSDPIRILQAITVFESGQVSFSSPVKVESPVMQPTDMAPVQWIATNAPFDTFVRQDSSTTQNPFDHADVRKGQLPKNAIPYDHYDFEEGAGARLNDRGSSQQLGRAWVEHGGRGTGHVARYSNEGDGHYQWVPGIKGKALLLDRDTVIRVRSKSSPIGPETISLWVHVVASVGEDGKRDETTDLISGTSRFLRLSANAFTLDLTADSGATFSFKRALASANLNSLSGITPGWNHFVFSYDLQTVTAWINGREIAKSDVSPAYQRTHSAPSIGFSKPLSPQAFGGRLAFSGAIDEVEVIGTALSADDIEKLSKQIPWRVFHSFSEN